MLKNAPRTFGSLVSQLWANQGLKTSALSEHVVQQSRRQICSLNIQSLDRCKSYARSLSLSLASLFLLRMGAFASVLLSDVRTQNIILDAMAAVVAPVPF